MDSEIQKTNCSKHSNLVSIPRALCSLSSTMTASLRKETATQMFSLYLLDLLCVFYVHQQPAERC